jgi:hypothetical protein
MSKIALSGNASGTGTFTIASPNSNSDRTLDLPDAGGTVVSTTATQTLTNKTLTSPAITTPTIDSAPLPTVSGTAPLYMCRAWVNFNGTGTVAIRASGNVSSITDNGVGNYTVNFTTAMPDASYCVMVLASDGTGSSSISEPQTLSHGTSSIRLDQRSGAGSNIDLQQMQVAIFR